MGVRVQRYADKLLGVGWRVREVWWRRKVVGGGVEEEEIVGRWWCIRVLDISRVHEDEGLEAFG